jgi:asparagine synthase (glutamine-hydrolysing)
MCGIFGVWRHQSNINPDALESATTAIRHRGPDDEGYLLVNTRSRRAELRAGRDTNPELDLPRLGRLGDDSFDLAFGFRRLSILDLSPAGHQPMASADGSAWLVFNGEVYNYLELRAELARLGHQFRTGTDTEVILAAYREWGTECLSHFVGMWALAICDLRERRLFLARDPFGIKPLFYAADAHRLVFGSEIKALLASGEVGRDVNPQRLYDYLTSGLTDHSGETLFADVRQLPPAHHLTVAFDDPVSVRPQRYWQIDLDKKSRVSFDEAAIRLRELFLDNVRLHLRSDVAVGAALSGGIDSSSIVMGMRRAYPDGALNAVSYIADDPAVSEERWIDMVDQAARAEVHKTHPTADDLIGDVDALIATQDEPFGSTSIYAQYRVFRRAREAGIIVMLDGQGADEMLAGYRPYLVSRLASLVRQRRWLSANNLIRRAGTLPGVNRKELLMVAGGMMMPSIVGRGKILRGPLRRLARRAGAVNGSPLTALNNEWFADRGATPWRYRNGNGEDVLRQALHDHLVSTSLPSLLRYEDRNSMAHSIESRVPFLTTAMAEFVLALPEEYLIAPDTTSKSVFRQAMRGVVPDAILDRRDKIGFATPEQRWLSKLRPWVDDVLHRGEQLRIPVLNMPALKEEWQQILAGSRGFDFRVWRWLNAIRWAEKMGVGF